MKLISLNTWGGRVGLKVLFNFFVAHKDADIFCLQEIWNGGKHLVDKEGKPLRNIIHELYKEISNALENHQGYFRPHFLEFYGLAIFIKKDFRVVEEGDLFVYKTRDYIPESKISKKAGNHARNMQYITIDTSTGKRTILNLHGIWTGGGKEDTEDRLEQTDRIINFIKNISHPYVLCCDFNLLPSTESLKRFEKFGLQNLILEYKISSTRTHLYPKEEKFADYVFVSRGIAVNEFKILPDIISDHSPLYLD